MNPTPLALTQAMKTKLKPILRVSDNSTGSHSTVYPNGTCVSDLVHSDGINHVHVEMVTEEQAQHVCDRRKIHFSTDTEFFHWLCQ